MAYVANSDTRKYRVYNRHPSLIVDEKKVKKKVRRRRIKKSIINNIIDFKGWI